MRNSLIKHLHVKSANVNQLKTSHLNNNYVKIFLNCAGSYMKDLHLFSGIYFLVTDVKMCLCTSCIMSGELNINPENDVI